MAKAYEGKQLDRPIVVADLLNGRSVATLQAAYPLHEADFLRLQGSPPATAALATIVFSGVVGYAVSLGPKIEPLFLGGKMELSSGETRTLVLGTTLALVLYGIGFFWPNEKKKVMKRISQHFQDAKPSTHIVGGAE